jgi:hypothetical protein
VSEPDRIRPDGDHRCPSCGSPRYVSVSLDGAWTRRAQCVPCGAYGDYLGPGWRGEQSLRTQERRAERARELLGHLPEWSRVQEHATDGAAAGRMWVQVSTALPTPPSFTEQIRRQVRHGMADVLEWCSIPVGPAPTDECHAVFVGGMLVVSEELAKAMGMPRGATGAWMSKPVGAS